MTEYAARGLRPQNANVHDERLMWTVPRNCVLLDTGDAWAMPRVLVVRLYVGDAWERRKKRTGAQLAHMCYDVWLTCAEDTRRGVVL